MNILLIEPNEICNGVCTLSDARSEHLRTFLHAVPGSRFRLGVTDSLLGWGTVTAVSNTEVTFSVELTEPALDPWFDLILAIPRPRSLKRIFFQTAAMGVRKLWLVGAQKVEKSYFSMHLLRPENSRPVLVDGCMQGRTTRIPEIAIVPKLRDLWEQLPSESTLRLIANPAERAPDFSASSSAPVLLAVGPDGGWTETENDAFAQHGFQPITLGPRPLRTDTAVIALAAVIQDRLTRSL